MRQFLPPQDYSKEFHKWERKQREDGDLAWHMVEKHRENKSNYLQILT